MRRGEIWWTDESAARPFVLLGEPGTGEFEAVRVVAPATVEQKRDT